jgi:hypothetical protein
METLHIEIACSMKVLYPGAVFSFEHPAQLQYSDALKNTVEISTVTHYYPYVRLYPSWI